MGAADVEIPAAIARVKAGGKVGVDGEDF